MYTLNNYFYYREKILTFFKNTKDNNLLNKK